MEEKTTGLQLKKLKSSTSFNGDGKSIRDETEVSPIEDEIGEELGGGDTEKVHKGKTLLKIEEHFPQI